MIVVLITSPKENSEEIARMLVDRRLCACVNIVDQVDSLFFWQGKIDKAKESLLIGKTKDELFSQLEKEVLKIHPYEVPEIVSFKLNNVSQPYCDWLNQVLEAND